MKKILILFLGLIMVLSLMACDKQNDDIEPTDSRIDETTASTDATAPTENESAEGAEPSNNIVYEDEDVRIQLEQWDFREDDKKLFVKMTAINKSDVEIVMESDDESINSWALLGISGRATIPAKETSEFNLFCDSDCFGKTGINSLDDIKEITYELVINKNDDRKYVNIVMSPTGDKTYDFVGHAVSENDVVLIDYSSENGEFKLIYKGNSVYDGKTVYLDYYSINTFKNNLSIEFSGITIGDERYNATPKMKEILANKEMITSCSIWSDEDVVSTNDTVQFKIKVMDLETYQYIVETEIFTIDINKS